MGIVSGAIGAIGSLGSLAAGAVSCIGSVCSAIGGAVIHAAGTIGSTLCRYAISGLGLANTAMSVADTVGTAASYFMERPSGERPEDIGIRAEEAPEKPENFDSVHQYIEYLRNEVKADEEKLKGLNSEQRLGYGMLGVGLYIKGLEEKLGMSLPEDVWKTAAELKYENKLSDKDFTYTLEQMKNRGLEDGQVFSDYFKGTPTLTFEEGKEVFDSLKEALRKENPNLSDKELNVKVSALKD